MGVPAPTANLTSMSVTLIEPLRQAAIDAPYHSGQEARKLADWLEMQPQRFVMLGINPDSYNVVVWVTSHFSCIVNS
jgi:hypothetical protein